MSPVTRHFSERGWKLSFVRNFRALILWKIYSPPALRVRRSEMWVVAAVWPSRKLFGKAFRANACLFVEMCTTGGLRALHSEAHSVTSHRRRKIFPPWQQNSLFFFFFSSSYNWNGSLVCRSHSNKMPGFLGEMMFLMHRSYHYLQLLNLRISHEGRHQVHGI
jgi:hypothetical protein